MNTDARCYKLLKALPQFAEGAILKKDGDSYKAVSALYYSVAAEESGATPSISAKYVEHESNSDWFQRVYEVNLVTKTVYKVREEALALIEKEYKN